MTAVQLCGDNDGNLTGMEGFIGKYSETSGALLSTLAANKIGDVTGVCKTLAVDPLAGEIIKSITLRYGPDKIDGISITASTGKTIFMGNKPEAFTDKLMTFTTAEQLVGFFGTHE